MIQCACGGEMRVTAVNDVSEVNREMREVVRWRCCTCCRRRQQTTELASDELARVRRLAYLYLRAGATAPAVPNGSIEVNPSP